MKELEAIYVMWWRVLVRLWRSKGRLAASMIQPVFFLIAFGLGLRGKGMLDFVLPGIVAMNVFMSSVMAGISVVWDREFGFLKEVLVAPVRRLTIVIGRASGAVTTALIQALWLIFLGFLFGAKINFSNTPQILLFLVFFSTFSVGIGLILSTKVEDMESFQALLNILVFPLIFLSNAFVNLELAPNWLAFIVKLNPISYFVDAIRFYMTGKAFFNLQMDFFVSLIFAALSVTLSAAMFERIEDL